jgi:hypothetical protein
MILDLAPGATVLVEGQSYNVAAVSTYYDEDFRLDIVSMNGSTPAHQRWLVAASPESYLVLMEHLTQQWLAPPQTSTLHEGDIFVSVYHGAAFRQQRGPGGRSKEGRQDYDFLRANSGRVILTLGRNEALEAWIGATLPSNAVRFPG